MENDDAVTRTEMFDLLERGVMLAIAELPEDKRQEIIDRWRADCRG